MESLLNQLPMVMAVLPFILALNLLLSGVYKALDVIKDKTKSEVDNKISAALHKVSDLLQKVLDMVGYNPKH